MSAILLLSQCDSIVTKTCDALIPVVQKTYEAGTNCFDAAIVFFICAAFICIAFIAKCAFLSWKSKKIAADKQEREFKKDKEKEECERKQKENEKNRIWQIEDEKRKQQYDLLRKKLDILRDLCYDMNKSWIYEDNKDIKECKESKENKESKEIKECKEEKENKKSEKILRDIDSDEVKQYRNALKDAMKLYSTPTNSVNDEETI